MDLFAANDNTNGTKYVYLLILYRIFGKLKDAFMTKNVNINCKKCSPVVLP